MLSEVEIQEEKMSEPTHQKAIVLASICWISLTNGLLYGHMTGMISSLQKHDEDIFLSENQIYWIATSVTTICLAGFIFAALIADKVGRRWSFTISSILMISNFIVLYFAKDMFLFMASRITAGIAIGSLVSLCICVTSEYTSSTKRAFYLNMITTVFPAIGTAFGHFLGILIHWRNVALIGIVFSSMSAILPYFWVESPHWLATKGKFAECEESFRKLHGTKLDKELRLLINMESCKIESATSKSIIKKLFLAFKRRYFWKLIILATIIYAYLAAAGKLLFSVLATVMLEDITGTSDVLSFTLFVDGLILLGSTLSCFLIRVMSMRTLLFSTGFIGNAVLLILSACLYFKTESYSQWINVGLLALYFVIINAGPYPVSEALMGEMFPSDLKLFCIFFSCITLVIFFTVSVMLLPFIVATMGYHGMFLLNTVIMSLSLGYIWIKLPETKGRTLQEIEIYFKTKDFDVDEALSNERSLI